MIYKNTVVLWGCDILLITFIRITEHIFDHIIVINIISTLLFHIVIILYKKFKPVLDLIAEAPIAVFVTGMAVLNAAEDAVSRVASGWFVVCQVIQIDKHD